jgi:NAD(P)-dependent dehydrogenase (short-subunit alcohol dehydrogenase family)
MGEHLVTGAASGIGLATVRRLAAAGHRVWALDHNPDRLERALEAAGLTGVGGLVSDVGDESSVESALRQVAADADHLDGLVNCAGIIPVAPFEQHSVSDWERSYRVNVIGTYLVLRAALPLLRAGQGASVVNLASMAAKIPGPYTVAYNASKAAVVSLTRSAAAALAPDIRVNAVCPGVVGTPMYEAIDARLHELGAPEMLRFEARAASAPAGRPASAEEIATVIEFLLGPGAAFVTGEDVNVTGGFVMH